LVVVNAAEHAGGSWDYEEPGATSSCSAAMSWAAAGGVAHAGHRARRSAGEASTGMATDGDSTWTEGACVAMAVERRCYGAGHVATATLPKQESLTEACGRTSGGKEDGASEQRPSFRMFQRMCIRRWSSGCCRRAGGCSRQEGSRGSSSADRWAGMAGLANDWKSMRLDAAIAVAVGEPAGGAAG